MDRFCAIVKTDDSTGVGPVRHTMLKGNRVDAKEWAAKKMEQLQGQYPTQVHYAVVYEATDILGEIPKPQPAPKWRKMMRKEKK